MKPQQRTPSKKRASLADFDDDASSPPPPPSNKKKQSPAAKHMTPERMAEKERVSVYAAQEKARKEAAIAFQECLSASPIVPSPPRPLSTSLGTPLKRAATTPSPQSTFQKSSGVRTREEKAKIREEGKEGRVKALKWAEDLKKANKNGSHYSKMNGSTTPSHVNSPYTVHSTPSKRSTRGEEGNDRARARAREWVAQTYGPEALLDEVSEHGSEVDEWNERKDESLPHDPFDIHEKSDYNESGWDEPPKQWWKWLAGCFMALAVVASAFSSSTVSPSAPVWTDQKPSSSPKCFFDNQTGDMIANPTIVGGTKTLCDTFVACPVNGVCEHGSLIHCDTWFKHVVNQECVLTPAALAMEQSVQMFLKKQADEHRAYNKGAHSTSALKEDGVIYVPASVLSNKFGKHIYDLIELIGYPYSIAEAADGTLMVGHLYSSSAYTSYSSPQDTVMGYASQQILVGGLLLLVALSLAYTAVDPFHRLGFYRAIPE